MRHSAFVRLSAALCAALMVFQAPCAPVWADEAIVEPSNGETAPPAADTVPSTAETTPAPEASAGTEEPVIPPPSVTVVASRDVSSDRASGATTEAAALPSDEGMVDDAALEAATMVPLEAAEGGDGAEAPGDPNVVSLDLRNIDIVDALKFLAMKAKLNIISTKNVSGRVTLMVENVPTMDVFDIMLRSGSVK